MQDKNGQEIEIGDRVLVPAGQSNDLVMNEFVGRVDRIYSDNTTICVVDGEDDAFDVDANTVEVQFDTPRQKYKKAK